jgi:hypothetical protein
MAEVQKPSAWVLNDVWDALVHAIQVKLVAGAAAIGAVKLEDAATATRAKVGTSQSVVEGDNVVGVQAPVLGVTTGAALDADGPGTHQQYLRGLLKAFLARVPIDPAKESGKLTDIASRLIDGASSAASLLASILARIPTLGPQTAAGSVSVTPASTLTAARTTAAAVSAARAGDNAIVAAVASQTVRVYRLVLVFAGTTTAIVKQGATALTGTMTFQPGATLVLDFSEEPWFTGASGAAINLTLGSAVQVSGLIQYKQA